MDWFKDVLRFHEELDHPIGGLPHIDLELMESIKAVNLVLEEVHELIVAVLRRDLVDTADSCVDLIYVVIGLAITFGIDLRPIWNAVHEANMNKQGGGKRDDGKQLKPENWCPPQLNVILDNQESLKDNS